MRIVFLNGPPGSGKDLFGSLLCNERDDQPWAATLKFAAPLRKHVAVLKPGLRDHEVEKIKNQDRKVREFMIRLSEDVYKPVYGSDIFGRIALDKILEIQAAGAAGVVITDSGFLSEAVPIANAFGVKNCLLIHLHRNGCSFEGDSRSYWFLDGIKTMSLWNNGTLQDLTVSADRLRPWVTGLVEEMPAV